MTRRILLRVGRLSVETVPLCLAPFVRRNNGPRYAFLRVGVLIFVWRKGADYRTWYERDGGKPITRRDLWREIWN